MSALFPQLLLDTHDELIIDVFAGGGGASSGIEQATGRQVDIAINHDAAAVALHALELNASYWADSVMHLKRAEAQASIPSLFDLEDIEAEPELEAMPV